MKKLLLVNMMPLLALIVFLFIGSCENNTPITSPDQQSLESIDQQLDALEKNVVELSLAVSDSSTGVVMSGGRDPKYCGNLEFPDSSQTPRDMLYEECPGYGDKYVDSKKIARLWANYTPIYQLLGWRACGKNHEVGIPQITGLSKSQQNNHPYFTWNFYYSHHYVIERKIGNGSWGVISTKGNCAKGEYPQDSRCGNSQSYLDTQINLSTLQNNVYYRVKGKIFSDTSFPSSTIVYTPPSVTVNISGPEQLLSGQSGTFVANASYGVPSTYTYSWSKFQYCNDRSQSNETDKDDGTRSIPCGFWESIPGNTPTVYVSGSFPEFQLKVTVTAQNGSATDYHFVDVILP